MVRILIILLLLVVLAVMYYSLQNEKFNHRKDNMYQSKQIRELKKKYNDLMRSSSEQFRNISLNSLPLSADTGIIEENTTLHIAPMERSASVNTINYKTQVNIIDQIECSNTPWYYIEIPSLGTHNSKGWIKKSDFTFISSTSKEIRNV